MSAKFQITSRTKESYTKKKDGTPYKPQFDGSPTYRVGLKFASQGDQWFNCMGDQEVTHLKQGDVVEGEIDGSFFNLDQVLGADSHVPLSPPPPSPPVIDDRQHSIIRQTAGKCAAAIMSGTSPSDEEVKRWIDFFYQDFLTLGEEAKAEPAPEIDLIEEARLVGMADMTLLTVLTKVGVTVVGAPGSELETSIAGATPAQIAEAAEEITAYGNKTATEALADGEDIPF